jgi:hypothetical protein
VTKILRTLLQSVLVLLIIAASLLWYAGFFNTVYITEKHSGPFYAIVQTVHQQDDPALIRNEIFRILFDRDIISHQALAVVPQPFSKNNQITRTGWIVSSADIQLASELDFPHQVLKIPAQQRIIADVAYNNPFSIFSGSIIVYKKLRKFLLKEKKTPGIMYEIYDDADNRIFYHLSTK